MANLSLSIPLPEEEPDILQRARTDPRTFAPIYECYARRIYGYCLRQVGDATEAEDLTSQIFAQAIRGLSGYRGGSVQAWLFRIAHNAVMGYFRSRKRRDDISPPGLVSESASEQALSNLIDAERYERLRVLVAALPRDQQELIALRVESSLSMKEIAVIVGKREGTVRVALHRLFQHLRTELLEEESHDAP